MINRDVKSNFKKYSLDEVINQFVDFRGRTPLKLGMDWGGGDIRALSANNVQMGYVDFTKEAYYGSETLYNRWMTKGHCEKGDVVITTEAPLGNVAQISDDKKYILSQRTILLKADKAIAESDFLFQLFQSEPFQKELIANSTGTTVVGIQQSRLAKIYIELPTKGEQQRIAKILKRIDRLIQKNNSLIAKYNAIKQGMMQDLLRRGIDGSRKLRPPYEADKGSYHETELGFLPDQWSVRKLEDVAQVNRGKFTVRPRNDPKYYGGPFPFIQTGDVTNNIGKVITTYSQTLNHSGTSVSREFPQNTIAVTIAANIADTAILGIPMYFPDSVVGVQVLPGFSVRFIELCIRMQKDSLRAIAPQSAQKNINLEDLRPLLIPVPPSDEQIRIAETYNAIDNTISLEQVSLSKLHAIKLGLMQDLLTGKVRVKVDESTGSKQDVGVLQS